MESNFFPSLHLPSFPLLSVLHPLPLFPTAGIPTVAPPTFRPVPRPDVTPPSVGTFLLYAQGQQIGHLPLNGTRLQKDMAKTLLSLHVKWTSAGVGLHRAFGSGQGPEAEGRPGGCLGCSLTAGVRRRCSCRKWGHCCPESRLTDPGFLQCASWGFRYVEREFQLCEDVEAVWGSTAKWTEP